MSWVRVDDMFWQHPKFLGVSEDALALWIRALAYTNGSKTDGFVPSTALCLLSRSKRPAKVAAELVSAGLWAIATNGWAFHDWAEYQATKETREKATAEKSRRQQEWRERQRGDASTETGGRPRVDASTPEHGDAAPTPIPSHPRSEIPLPPSPAKPAPTKEPAAPRKRPATRQPDIGVPEWLAGLGLPALTDPRWGSEVAKWLDHHRSKDSRFADWAAAWRTWERNAKDWGRAPPPPPTSPRPSGSDPRVIIDDEGMHWDWDLHGPPPEGLPPGTRHRNHPSTKPRSA